MMVFNHNNQETFWNQTDYVAGAVEYRKSLKGLLKDVNKIVQADDCFYGIYRA